MEPDPKANPRYLGDEVEAPDPRDVESLSGTIEAIQERGRIFTVPEWPGFAQRLYEFTNARLNQLVSGNVASMEEVAALRAEIKVGRMILDWPKQDAQAIAALRQQLADLDHPDDESGL